uniref:Uncharacterized protein n=1 Tax=Rhizophora mucronata TaxID=61149 RepID=A0A2P2L258_RHIMU
MYGCGGLVIHFHPPYLILLYCPSMTSPHTLQASSSYPRNLISDDRDECFFLCY